MGARTHSSPHNMQKKHGRAGFMPAWGGSIAWSEVKWSEGMTSPVFTTVPPRSPASFFLLLPQTASFSVKINPECVSARRRLKILDRALQWKCLESPFLSALPHCGSWAHCSDSVLSFRLRCSIIRGWGLHHKVPSSEEFIQPLPQWVLCAAAAAGPSHPTTSHSLLSLFSSPHLS